MRFVLVVSALAAAIVPGWRIDGFVSHLAIQFAQKGGYQVAAIERRPENAALARSGPAFCSTLTSRWWTASTDTPWLGGREALEDAGIELAVWRIHHHIGMSGDCSRTPCCGRSDIR